MKLSSPKRLRSVLGLALTGDRLSFCHVARTNGSASVLQAGMATLLSDPLVAGPEAGGALIRAQLAAAGIREKRCAVVLPAGWLMTRQTKVPELSGDDLAGYLQLEAEKGFPVDPIHLQIATSTSKAGGATYVTQLAARKEQVQQLVATLVAAGLKPVGLSPGLPALPGAVPSADTGRVSVALDASGATLLVGAGGGISALRTAETESLARELRITCEQIPAELRASLGRLQWCGDETLIRAAEAGLSAWAAAAGLTVVPRGAAERPLDEQYAEQIARRSLANATPELEFLPPRPSQLARLVARYSSKRLAFAGAAVAAAAVLVLGTFGWQEYRRWSLRNEWNGLRAQVEDLTAVQSLLRDYRPWYDSSFHNLGILRRVTENFPDNGSVTAKSFEIRGPASISISGTARDNPSLLQTLDRLRQAREIQDLKVEQIRGKAPLQFTLSFHWRDASGA